MRDLASLVGKHEETILVPGDFMNLHPEGVDMDRVRWLFILFPRRPHRKIATGYGRHAIRNQRIWDSDFVSPHLTIQRVALNTRVDTSLDLVFIGGASNRRVERHIFRPARALLDPALQNTQLVVGQSRTARRHSPFAIRW